MPASMTAFAVREAETELGRISWELRSVNHRYLEVQPRLPEALRALEPEVRERVGAVLGRGRVECVLRFAPADGAPGLAVDEDLVRDLVHASETVESQLSDPVPLSAWDLLQWPGVVRRPEPDRATLREPVLDLLDATLDEMSASRNREGEALAAMLIDRCDKIAELVGKERENAGYINDSLRERLRARVAELGVEVDSGRLEQEVVYHAQRIDVSEELDRLDTHVEAVRAALASEEPVGRRLDFLMQELNREANTLGSKSADAGRSGAGVELKVLIEQMREQVQNIE
jgi:uncharacterized protein (TIGR00255 family)